MLKGRFHQYWLAQCLEHSPKPSADVSFFIIVTVLFLSPRCMSKSKKRSLFSFDLQSQRKQNRSPSPSLIWAGIWIWHALTMSHFARKFKFQGQSGLQASSLCQVPFVEELALSWTGPVHTQCPVECKRISSAENLWIFAWKRKTILRKLTEPCFMRFKQQCFNWNHELIPMIFSF